VEKPLVVVTGASSGIGEAIARRFAEAGHPLLLLARRLNRLQALGLPDSICAKVDVTDRAALEAAIRSAEAEYGATDCLVNNAGTLVLGELDAQDAEAWRKMFDVNVLALMNGIQCVLGAMKERRHGTIINMSSIAGRKTFSDHAAYCGTKFAIHAIGESVREGVAAHGVRVITIAPGAVETEMLSQTASEALINDYEDWKRKIGGALEPDAVARATLFAYQQPQNVCLREIVLSATGQNS